MVFWAAMWGMARLTCATSTYFLDEGTAVTRSAATTAFLKPRWRFTSWGLISLRKRKNLPGAEE